MNVFLKTNTFQSFSVFLRLIKESFDITISLVADMKLIMFGKCIYVNVF